MGIAWHITKNTYALPLAARPISTMVVSMVSLPTKIRGRPSLSLRAWRCNAGMLTSKFGFFAILAVFNENQRKKCQKHPKIADFQHPPLGKLLSGPDFFWKYASYLLIIILKIGSIFPNIFWPLRKFAQGGKCWCYGTQNRGTWTSWTERYIYIYITWFATGP